MTPHQNTGGDEQAAINDAVFVLAAIPADALDALGAAYCTHGDLPVDVFVPYAAAHGCGADSLRNAFCRMMEHPQPPPPSLSTLPVETVRAVSATLKPKPAPGGHPGDIQEKPAN